MTTRRRGLLTLVLVSLMAWTSSAQTPKKVFISVDMEGISGISGSDQLSAAGAEYTGRAS